MIALVAMLLLGAACWVVRILFIVVVPAERLPASARAALGQLAPAVLAALVVVEADSAARGADLTTAGLVVGSLVVAGLAVRLTGSLLHHHVPADVLRAHPVPHRTDPTRDLHHPGRPPPWPTIAARRRQGRIIALTGE